MPTLQREDATGLPIVVPGVHVGGRASSNQLELGSRELRLEPRDDGVRDLVLNVKEIGSRTIEAPGPKVIAGLGFDQLDRHAQPIANRTQAAFDDISHPKLAANLPDVALLSFVRKRGVTSDDKKTRDLNRTGFAGGSNS